ncbi:MAG TPA: sulfite exporter TauE/SafE family protein [Pseudolabrys sp.]|nr:sulfite exporter TauE/SafE family protein [Pseudolabrys sp.]
MDALPQLAEIAGVFVLAGAVKGMIGMGLPTVAIGILGLFMTPAEAAAVLVLPTLVTNIWQAAAGRAFFRLLRRLWPMFAGIFLGAWIGAVVLHSVASPWARTALGAVLVIYALLGLSNVHFSVAPKAEAWLAPPVGIVNGIVSVATGVFSLPALFYLNGLHFRRDELVQALGMLFTMSTVALALALVHGGILHSSAAIPSVLALAASIVGMVLGQLVRNRIKAELFRKVFLVGLLLLGAHLALHSIL